MTSVVVFQTEIEGIRLYIENSDMKNEPMNICDIKKKDVVLSTNHQ